MDPESIKNGVGNWVTFFVGLEEWKWEGVAGGGLGSEHRGDREPHHDFRRSEGIQWGEIPWLLGAPDAFPMCPWSDQLDMRFVL